MKIRIDDLINQCTFTGGAVDPPRVLALCRLIDAYADITARFAAFVSHPYPTAEMLESIANELRSVLWVELPDPVPAKGMMAS